jgi:hypothetical protein
MLRDYQYQIAQQAHHLLSFYRIAYLALEVRVGKTLISLEAARLCGVKNVLFVTKKKAMSSIQKDYDALSPGYQLTLINYDSLHKIEPGHDMVIIDEAHSLGQYPKPSQRTEHLRKLCTGLPIIYLSGTPTPESFAQVYHQFWVSSFSPFAEFKNFYFWHKKYGIPAVKYIYNRQINDYSKTTGVMDAVQHLFISYTQQQAGFEALVEERVIKLPMPDVIAKSIKILRRDKIITTRTGHVILADTKVKEMQKVHQLCGGTVKAEDGERIVVDTSKAEHIKAAFAGQKVVIFYKYIAEATALRQVLGSMIIDESDAFNSHAEPCYFISQIQSGREGVNLSGADTLVFYNIDFAAVSYWQARARIQKLERKEPAVVHWLFFSGGIEELVYQIVIKKKDFTVQHYK